MSAGLIRGNAVAIPLRSESVDLVVTSPPYFSLRSYRDQGAHFDAQIGSEPTPQAFLEALWSVMHECWRVLKPEGVCFVNLGDKRSGSGGHNNSNLGATSTLSSKAKEYHAGHGERRDRATRRNAPDRYNQAAFGRAKSKMLLPHRFAIGCEDGLADPEGRGWIVRSDIVWSKPNGLPESVTDRPRDSHEFWFMLTKEGRYYSAVDEVREPHAEASILRAAAHRADPGRAAREGRIHGQPAHSLNLAQMNNPLGKLPGSVWTIPSEPLRVPDWARERLDLPDHFAAFPTEWPRRLILGWSPPGGVVLDPFVGTGTVPMVARVLGRYGVGIDLSADYLRLSRWRTFESGHAAKAINRTNGERQGALL